MKLQGTFVLPHNIADYGFTEIAEYVSELLPWATDIHIHLVSIPTVPVEAETTDGIEFTIEDPIGYCEIVFTAEHNN